MDTNQETDVKLVTTAVEKLIGPNNDAKRLASLGLLVSLASAYLIPYLPAYHLGSLTVGLFGVSAIWMVYIWQLAQEDQRQEVLTWVMALGVAARLLLIGVPAFTTHDLERYLWDGAVLLNGFDPYQIHPDHASVAHLREIWATPEEHTAYPTLYPPLALGMFSLCAMAGPAMGIWAFKFLVTTASLCSLLIMRDVLRRLGQEQNLALFALSPLLLLETGIGAHLDTFTVLAISLALWCLVRRHWWWAGFAIGCGACIKLLPLVALGPMLFANPWRRWPKIIIGASIAILVCYSVALAWGLIPIGSLPAFFSKWRFGSPIVSTLETLQLIEIGEEHGLWQSLMPIVLLALMAGLYASWRSSRDLFVGMTIMLSIPLMLSPMVFPWYLMILVPLLTVRPNLLLLVWLISAPLTYEVLNGFAAHGVWKPADWPLWIIGLGWGVAIVVSARLPMRKKVAAAA